jgi:hypothetical protein
MCTGRAVFGTLQSTDKASAGISTKKIDRPTQRISSHVWMLNMAVRGYDIGRIRYRTSIGAALITLAQEYSR